MGCGASKGGGSLGGTSYLKIFKIARGPTSMLVDTIRIVKLPGGPRIFSVKHADVRKDAQYFSVN